MTGKNPVLLNEVITAILALRRDGVDERPQGGYTSDRLLQVIGRGSKSRLLTLQEEGLAAITTQERIVQGIEALPLPDPISFLFQQAWSGIKAELEADAQAVRREAVAKIAATEEAIRRLAQSLDEAKESLAEQETKNRHLEEEGEQRDRSLEDARRGLQGLQTAIERRDSEIAAEKATSADLRQRLVSQGRELAEVRHQMDTRVQEAQRALQERERTHAKERGALEARVATLEADQAHATTVRLDLEQKLAETQGERLDAIAGLQGRIEDLVRQIGGLEGANRILERDVEDAKRAALHATEREQGLKAKLEQVEGEVNRLKRRKTTEQVKG